MERPATSSPFFHTPPTAEAESLAILHLKRDSLIPVNLRATADDGYAEGAVMNTRFGSFPHSTLIGLEWGSQVRASRVDTGSRGRKGKKGKQQNAVGANDYEEVGVKSGGTDEDGVDKEGGHGKKRKSDPAELYDEEGVAKKARQDGVPQSSDAPRPVVKKQKQTAAGLTNGEAESPAAVKAPIEAGSGFIHVLQPTPESWTSSLDHRTQVVYTADSSYILQRLRVRPGSTIIEAGAGSGSFTHAAARAVFSGYQSKSPLNPNKRKIGQVYSYEFHEPRVQTLREELADHGLDGIVQLTHRDVCNEGFALPHSSNPGSSPNVEAIFLDLPAPWLALRHLTRSSPSTPLNPDAPVHICTFSPCIEQVTATVSALRKAGWTDIEMVEVQNHRIDVRREQIGTKNEGLRGVNASAATVEESIQRLKEVECKLSEFHAAKSSAIDGAQAANPPQTTNGAQDANGEKPGKHSKGGSGKKPQSKAARLEKLKKDFEERKLYLEGNLVHRTEPEVKTHTSYLVFAVLPREWTEEDERAAEERWSVGEVMKGSKGETEEGGMLDGQADGEGKVSGT